MNSVNLRLVATTVTALGGFIAMASPNLIINGDMTDAVRFDAECKPYGEDGVKLSRHSEEITWNACGKVELTAPHKPCEYATVLIGAGTKIGLQGFPIEPNGTYELKFDVRGNIEKLRVNVVTWTGEDEWKGRKTEATSIGLAPVKENWTTHRATFTVGPDAHRAAIEFRMWRDEKNGAPYKQGDYYLFDNVSVRDRQGGLKDLAAKIKKPFALAPVPVTVDMGVPFVPDELNHPIDAIKVRAAVNELKAVPLALANLTGQPEEYRISLETVKPEKGINNFDGRFGLNGLDPKTITMRKGLRYRQSRWIEDGLKIDPLVKMDEARSISIPSMDAGLLWIDFDLTGVKPGIYRGILRVLPFTGEGYFVRQGGFQFGKFVGPSRDYPFELEVMDIELDREPAVPAMLDGAALNEDLFRYMTSLGCREYMLTPWAFKFETNSVGEVIAEKYMPMPWEYGDMRKTIREHLQWAKNCSTKITFQIGFNAYTVVFGMYGVKDLEGTPAGDRLWTSWLKAVDAFMREQGLKQEDWNLEVWDEPSPKAIDRVEHSLKLLHETTPQITVTIPFVSHPNNYTIEQLKRVMPYIDIVNFHDETHFRNPGFTDYIAALRKDGKKIFHYTCSTRMTEDLDREFRQNAWMAERWNLHGNNIFQIVDAQGGTGASDWKTPTGGGLLYRSYDVFVPSVRYMAMREGVQDVKYVAALKKLAKGDKKVLESIAKAAKLVTDNPAGGDRYLADKVRDKIIAQMENYKKHQSNDNQK